MTKNHGYSKVTGMQTSVSKGKLLALFFMPVLFVFSAGAQTVRDTVLKAVDIKSTHKRSADTRINDFSPGQKITTIDSATLQQYQLQSLANVLTQQVPVYVKSYGFNGLATLNFRGSSSAQSAVYWNGVPIQNAALGVADVSTLPVLLMNKVNIVYGGSAALWGSGNVGGALVVENDVPVFDSCRHSLAVSLGSGSFGQYMGGIKGSFATRRWYFGSSLFGQSAQNDFPYTDNTGSERTINNSKLQSVAALVQAAYEIDATSTVGLYAWYQRYDREIPETLTDPYSVKKQIDGSARLLLNWDKQARSGVWYAKASFINDAIDYTDSAVAIHSSFTVHQYFHEVGWKRQLGNGLLMVFAPAQVGWLDVLPGQTKQQTRWALAAAYEHKLLANRVNIAGNLRAELVNDKKILLPGVNAAFAITNWLSVRANAQRTYRVPTLNELYYFPGGNANLKPEQGWAGDAGYTVKLRVGDVRLYHDAAVYGRDIHDWIIWLGNAVWTPYNIAEVYSRGIETENKITYNIGELRLHAGLNTAYTLATTTASYAYNDGSIGKQIPYAPRYHAIANIGAGYRRLYFNYNHTYTGYRFYTTDESAYLLPYNTGNVQVMYTAEVAKHVAQLTAQCNNIWNEHYQVVANRPMPGINWQAGIQVQLF
jgi:vitamin B12 transporter